MYKVCIQAAGIGSRLTVCEGLHKALVPINQKSILTRIIDLYPTDTEFIILVGYKKEQIKAFLNITHPNWKIEYIEVKNFQGVGSGPGFSLLQAKKKLESPFIFMACDTIVEERPPLPDKNWVGVSDSKTSEEYLIVEIKNNKVSDFFDKKSKQFIYKNSSKYADNKKQTFDAFIGLAGVYNYKVFWNALEKQSQLCRGEVQVTSGLKALIQKPLCTETIKFTWIDTGTDKSYSNAKKYFKDNFIYKSDEYLYKEKEIIIKYFSDPSRASKLHKRSNNLEGVNPKVYKSGTNFMWYEYVKGTLISNTNEKRIFLNFLNFMNAKLWSKKIESIAYIDSLEKMADKFYRLKTYERVNKYLEVNAKADKINWINNDVVVPIYNLLEEVDWKYLSKGFFSKFHGDPQPENIIVKSPKKFVLIDWREDFGGDLKFGDVYYDLAKIYHALIITHQKIREKKYEVYFTNKFAFYKFSKRRNLLKYLKYFEEFIVNNNFSLYKVKLISALIYLNIAPLHHNPYSQLLFFHGKLELYKLLKKQ